MFITDTSKANVLNWFKGKAHLNAVTALQMLEDSEKAGEWLPGVSRSVRAALSKSNIGIKIAKEFESIIGSLVDDVGTRLSPSWYLMHYMHFGQFEKAAVAGFNFDLYEERLEKRRHFFTRNYNDIKAALASAKTWVRDMTPVAQLIAQLDSARPAPVFTNIGASPTITRTLSDLGFGSASKVRLCPMRFERVEQTDDKGRKFTVPICILEWPADTVFGASRFAHIGDRWPEGQCHACGHGIKSETNWVPLIIDDPAGIPHALWVGVDCCRTLFGIKVKGEIRIQGKDGVS